MKITEATRLAINFSKAIDVDEFFGNTETWPEFINLLDLHKNEAAFHARNKAIEEFKKIVRDFVPPTSDPTVYYGWRKCRMELEEKIKQLI